MKNNSDLNNSENVTENKPNPLTAKTDLKLTNVGKSIGRFVLFIPAAILTIILTVKWYYNQNNFLFLLTGMLFFIFSVMLFINAFRQWGGGKDERAIKKDEKTWAS